MESISYSTLSWLFLICRCVRLDQLIIGEPRIICYIGIGSLNECMHIPVDVLGERHLYEEEFENSLPEFRRLNVGFAMCVNTAVYTFLREMEPPPNARQSITLYKY